MTDNNPFPDDDLLSAHVDGETDRAQTQRLEAAVAADPQVAARLEALRAARDAVGAATPPAPDPEEFIATALAEFDTGTRAGSVTSLAGARRGRGWAADPRYLAAAAAVVVALLGVGVIASGSLDRGSDDQIATGAAQDDAAQDDAADTGADRSSAQEAPELFDTGEAGAGAGSGGTPTGGVASAPAPAWLGSYDRVEDLAAVLEGRFAEQPPTAGDDEEGDGDDASTGECPVSSARDTSTADAPVVFDAGLTFQGQPAQVFVFDAGEPEPFEVVVVESGTCTVVAGFSLDRPA